MKHRLREKLSGISYRYMLTVGIPVFVLIFAAVFFGYTYRTNERKYREETGQRTELLAKRMTEQIEEKLGIFEKYYISAADEDEIEWILQNDFTYSDYSRYKAVMDIMSTRKMFMDYLDGYSLILYKTGWVIGSKGVMRLDEITDRDKISELYRQNRLSGERRQWNYEPIEETVAGGPVDAQSRNRIDTSGLTLVMRLPFDSIIANSLAVVRFNMKTLKKWVAEAEDENAATVILDSDGNVVFSTDAIYESTAVALAKTEIKGYKYIKEKDIPECVAAHSCSGINGWDYYVFTALGRDGSRQSNYSSWAEPVLLLLAVSVFLIALTYMIYRPLHGLVREVTGNNPERAVGNEFTLISGHLSNLRNDRTVLERMVRGQESKIREMFERRLINEGIKSEDEWNDYFNGLRLPNYSCFATGVLVLDLRQYTDTQNVINEDAICLQVIDSMPEDIVDLLWMPPIYNSCAIVVFFGAEDEDRLLGNILAFHEKIQKFTFENTGYHLLAGISSTCHDHRHFRRAYRESVKALTKQGYEDYSGSEGVVNDTDAPELRFYTAAKPTLKGDSYSNDFENDVRIAIKEVDRHKAYQTTDRFAEHLATVSTGDVSVLYILRYVNSIVLTGMEAGVVPDTVFPDGIRQTYAELLSEIEPRKVRMKIKQYFIDPIVDRLTEKMQDDSYNVMEAIDRLMDKTKGNILLSECADELGVHQTYIWKILKMEKGKSFTEYAEKYKIEEAKKLLLQTNMSVQEIAASLDYANAQNFIRFFSKVTGVTPGKFRKLN